ncbi:MAG TPA: MBL fold metallo-hydrolase [Caulobacteraceae bacterium]|jgi:flavorubredoxin
METQVDEIAAGVYRLSTLAPEIAPGGFSFNQFLLDADEPLLFHCGHRRMFPLISAAVAKVMPLERLRWISFGHVEADECGGMNLWLAAAPQAQVAHGQLACDVSLNDLADRAPRALADGEALDLGGKRVRFLHTPHVPHGWEAGVMFEETAATLLCGDLLTHTGAGPAITEHDVLGPAIGAEDMFHAMCMGPGTGPALRRLADLQPRTLAIMHGSAFAGDGAAALNGLAQHYAGAALVA